MDLHSPYCSHNSACLQLLNQKLETKILRMVHMIEDRLKDLSQPRHFLQSRISHLNTFKVLQIQCLHRVWHNQQHKGHGYPMLLSTTKDQLRFHCFHQKLRYLDDYQVLVRFLIPLKQLHEGSFYLGDKLHRRTWILTKSWDQQHHMPHKMNRVDKYRHPRLWSCCS